jgi:hypothetical protein
MAGSRYRVVAASATSRDPEGIDAGGEAKGLDPGPPEPADPLSGDDVRGSALDEVPE